MTQNHNLHMTPNQALEILEKATSQIQATREDHNLLIYALQVINEVIEKSTDETNADEGLDKSKLTDTDL